MTGTAPKRTIPAEWTPHRALWTAWPSHADLWEDNLPGARDEVAAMVRIVAAGEPVKVLACGEESVASARRALDGVAEVIAAEFGDIWLRDTGPIFALEGSAVLALRFRNNGWGGKYILEGDDRVGDLVAAAAGSAVRQFDFILEGGALEHNGDGVVLTTRQCLLNANRNAGWNESAAEAALARALHCRRVLWLEEGLMNDHTDGHVDNLARFVSPTVAVCQAASGDDDPNAGVYEQIALELRAAGLDLHQIPSPGLVLDAGNRPMPASHMNFIIANAAVVVPVYPTGHGEAAVAALQALFPRRKVVGLPSKHLLTGGGSFHCITQQEPQPRGVTT